MTTAYRIFKTKYASAWFDGEGSYRFGGRWNTAGTRLLYASATASLALLEMLVHLEDETMAAAYSSAALSFDAKHVITVSEFKKLPRNWHAAVVSPKTQAIGDEWARSLESAVLRVPSAVVRDEYNYLFNVDHPDFKSVRLGKPTAFVFDDRLNG